MIDVKKALVGVAAAGLLALVACNKPAAEAEAPAEAAAVTEPAPAADVPADATAPASDMAAPATPAPGAPHTPEPATGY
jgi:hypothetical protein